MAQQMFITGSESQWVNLEQFPGAQILSLAEPVPEGSIHRLRIEKGTVVPSHTHPCDEYVYVLAGSVKTGQRVCTEGNFWYTPAQVKQGPHCALTDAELLTVRLGKMGQFEPADSCE